MTIMFHTQYSQKLVIMELIFLIKEKMKIILEVINSIKNFCKNTRGVRIVKCRVNSDGKKIVVFQALGSFHTEDMDYEDYKNGLIYDTEPYDVELAAIFFIVLILINIKFIVLIQSTKKYQSVIQLKKT